MTNETEFILVGQAARILKRPDHQVRRTADRLWPDAPRSGRFRLIPRADLCRLAAAIAERYPVRNASSIDAASSRRTNPAKANSPDSR